MTTHEGWSSTRASEGLVVRPDDVLVCCDLRCFPMNGEDLSRVLFLGCLLNGTTFLRSDLSGARFIGCFSSDDGLPTAFLGARLDGATVIRSHLHSVSERALPGETRWTDELARVASATLAERNDVRYDAVRRLDDMGDPTVIPLLGALLNDPEWEVRAVVVRTLAQSLARTGERWDADFQRWTLRRLGDEHAMVRQPAMRLVELLSPSDAVLQSVVRRTEAATAEERLVGLNAGVELYRHDPRYARLLDLDSVRACLTDEQEDVRETAALLLSTIASDGEG